MHDALTVATFVPGVHHVDAFDCGHGDITQWLKDRVHEAGWPDKTSVTVALDDDRVVGFYALLNSVIKYKTAPMALTSVQHDRFDIPATYLKVIAVDNGYKNEGLGSELLLHALERAAAAAELVTSFAVSLHAVDDAVADWYGKRGFVPLIEGDPKRSMYLKMSDVRATFDQ